PELHFSTSILPLVPTVYVQKSSVLLPRLGRHYANENRRRATPRTLPFADVAGTGGLPASASLALLRSFLLACKPVKMKEIAHRQSREGVEPLVFLTGGEFSAAMPVRDYLTLKTVRVHNLQRKRWSEASRHGRKTFELGVNSPSLRRIKGDESNRESRRALQYGVIVSGITRVGEQRIRNH